MKYRLLIAWMEDIDDRPLTFDDPAVTPYTFEIADAVKPFAALIAAGYAFFGDFTSIDTVSVLQVEVNGQWEDIN